jgi:GMP synthase-like glutamine amidotransferase
MKPILILRFSPTEGPGFLAHYLNARHLPWKLLCLDHGEPVPVTITGISALALMGGPMSVNDELPWIQPALNLIRAAINNDVPVIGHCLGGQLLAKALGAEVIDNSCKEMGWASVDVASQTVAHAWFGGARRFDVFHWHYQTFGIPDGAEKVMQSAWCENQAFIYNNRHIAFQCHIEMTALMVRQWCDDEAAQLQAAKHEPSVQSVEQILRGLPNRINSLNILASNVYERWLEPIEYETLSLRI